jgi:hypothetical protein
LIQSVINNNKRKKPNLGIKEALILSLPDELNIYIELIRISRHLNSGIKTSYYNPEVLKKMPQNDIDNLIMAVTFENIS